MGNLISRLNGISNSILIKKEASDYCWKAIVCRVPYLPERKSFMISIGANNLLLDTILKFCSPGK